MESKKLQVIRVEPIHKATMLKQVRKTGVFFGYIAPNKVNSFHITGGWHIGMSVIICTDREGNIYYVSPNYNYESLNGLISNFSYYNCNSELGNTVRFWEVV